MRWPSMCSVWKSLSRYTIVSPSPFILKMSSSISFAFAGSGQRTGLVSIRSVSYTHLDVYKRQLKKLGREDIVVIAGGVIPAQDYDFLYKAGVAAIFGDVYKRQGQCQGVGHLE